MSPKAGPLTTDVPKLRRVLDALLEHVQRTEGALVEVDRDHYWLLELTAAFSEASMSQAPNLTTSVSARSQTMSRQSMN